MPARVSADPGGHALVYGAESREHDRRHVMEIDAYEPGVPSWVDLGSARSRSRPPTSTPRCSGGTCPEGPPEAGGYRVAHDR